MQKELRVDFGHVRRPSVMERDGDEVPQVRRGGEDHGHFARHAQAVAVLLGILEAHFVAPHAHLLGAAGRRGGIKRSFGLWRGLARAGLAGGALAGVDRGGIGRRIAHHGLLNMHAQHRLLLRLLEAGGGLAASIAVNRLCIDAGMW